MARPRRARRGALGGVALADAAEVELERRARARVVPVDRDVAAAGAPLDCRTVSGRDELEGTVVARCDEGVVDSGVETPAGPLARLRGRARSPPPGPGRVDRARPFSRESSESARKRESSFSSRWNSASASPSACLTRSVEEELDLRAHRAKCAALHHDVLVTVSGGRVTTRTEGAAAASELLRALRPRSAPAGLRSSR